MIAKLLLLLLVYTDAPYLIGHFGMTSKLVVVKHDDRLTCKRRWAEGQTHTHTYKSKQCKKIFKKNNNNLSL
jgi:hypothetical protein